MSTSALYFDQSISQVLHIVGHENSSFSHIYYMPTWLWRCVHSWLMVEVWGRMKYRVMSLASRSPAGSFKGEDSTLSWREWHACLYIGKGRIGEHYLWRLHPYSGWQCTRYISGLYDHEEKKTRHWIIPKSLWQKVLSLDLSYCP